MLWLSIHIKGLYLYKKELNVFIKKGMKCIRMKGKGMKGIYLWKVCVYIFKGWRYMYEREEMFIYIKGMKGIYIYERYENYIYMKGMKSIWMKGMAEWRYKRNSWSREAKNSG